MPLPETDFRELTDMAAEKHPAFRAFKTEMIGRCYGREALNDAWAWFQEGWERCDVWAGRSGADTCSG